MMRLRHTRLPNFVAPLGPVLALMDGPFPKIAKTPWGVGDTREVEQNRLRKGKSGGVGNYEFLHPKPPASYPLLRPRVVDCGTNAAWKRRQKSIHPGCRSA